MTIATIDTVVADVMLMTELDWLLALDPLAGVPARPSDLRRDPEGCEQNKDGAINRGPRQIVRAVTENLWHLPLIKNVSLADVLRRSSLPTDGSIPSLTLSEKNCTQ